MLYFAAPVVGKMPQANFPKMSVIFEVILRGELGIQPQQSASLDQKPEIVETNNENEIAMLKANEDANVEDKCAELGKFCTSDGPFCCKPLTCVNIVFVGIGLCENIQT